MEFSSGGFEDQFHLLLESLTDYAFFLLNTDGYVARWSSGAERVLGYDQAEALGQPFALFFTPEERVDGRPDAELREAAERGRAEANGWRLRRDGLRVWVSGVTIALRDDTGQLRGFAEVMRDHTEQRRAAEAVRESERLFRCTIDALPAHLCVLDESGRILAVNRAWREFAAANAGGTRGLLEGANYLAVCDAAGRAGCPEGAAFAAGLRDVLAGRRRELALTYPCPAAGPERWFLARVTRFVDDGPPRAVVTHENITERRRAEERLRYQLQLTDTIANRAAEALFLLDAHGYVTFMNPAAEALLGWKLDDLAGVRLQDVVRRRGPGAALPAGGPAPEVAAGQGLQDHEDVFYHRDGTPIFVRCSNAPVTAAGKVTGAVLVVSDITGKRLAGERLRASEERFRSLSACSPVGIFMTDVAGRWTYANPRLRALGGFRAAEGLGDGWLLYVHPQDRDSLATGWAEAARAGRPIEAEFRFRPPDGPERVVHLRSSPMLGDHGRLLGHVGSVEDVTDRRHMEDELRARAERLAEVDRRKDEWVAMLAHELRGPLTPVRNAVQVLRLGDVSAPQLRRACDMIARQVGHLAQIVDDLLDVTRLTRGAVRLRKERLDLGRLIRIAVDDHVPLVQQAGLSLDTELPGTPVWVLGDDARLAQVVNNLLENAVKFTPRGGHVRVRLSADGGSARLVVSDSGAGIDAELLPRLFDVFSQADRSLPRTGGGLGLGLAIVKSLAELHGGTVTAASEGPGLGAEFTVAIPAIEEPAALARADGAAPKPGRHLRVLIVEDNRDAADSLRMLLELLGHETRVSYTGTDGVKAASEWRPDIILSDIGLPGLDGFGVARALRDNPLTARTRLIAVTGYGSDDDRRRARESGFDFVLTKPAEPEALLRLLDAG